MYIYAHVCYPTLNIVQDKGLQDKTPYYFFSPSSSAASSSFFPLNYKALVIKSTLGRSLSSTPLSVRHTAHVRLPCEEQGFTESVTSHNTPTQPRLPLLFIQAPQHVQDNCIDVMSADTKWNVNESHIHHRVPESIWHPTYYHSVLLCQLLATRKYNEMTVAVWHGDYHHLLRVASAVRLSPTQGEWWGEEGEPPGPVKNGVNFSSYGKGKNGLSMATERVLKGGNTELRSATPSLWERSQTLTVTHAWKKQTKKMAD